MCWCFISCSFIRCTFSQFLLSGYPVCKVGGGTSRGTRDVSQSAYQHKLSNCQKLQKQGQLSIFLLFSATEVVACVDVLVGVSSVGVDESCIVVDTTVVDFIAITRASHIMWLKVTKKSMNRSNFMMLDDTLPKRRMEENPWLPFHLYIFF